MANWGRLPGRGKVEDRRMLGPTSIGGLGIGGLALVLLFSYLNTGTIDVGTILNELESAQVREDGDFDKSQFEGADSYEVFVSTVLGSTDEAWSQIFAHAGETYSKPKLVLFRGSTQSSCGGADSSVGPHYCPYDSTIYLDETFFDELQKLGGQGDVAEAYVIAHEVGHHVQNQLGILDAERISADSIAVELQADCFAGLWAHSIKDLGVFEDGEIREAIDAAAAVGDDRIQGTFQGRITPETWTHGSAEARVGAFTNGFEKGTVAACTR